MDWLLEREGFAGHVVNRVLQARPALVHCLGGVDGALSHIRESYFEASDIIFAEVFSLFFWKAVYAVPVHSG